MKLYILTQKVSVVGYDENDAMVIRAFNPADARKIANKFAADEGKIWTSAKHVSCRVLPPTGKSKLILRSFNAG